MTQLIALHVTGITCSGCEQRAETVLRRLPNVVEASADHHTGQITVTIADGPGVDRALVAARLSAAGFEPVQDLAP